MKVAEAVILRAAGVMWINSALVGSVWPFNWCQDPEVRVDDSTCQLGTERTNVVEVSQKVKEW